jgi:S-adenosyl-L-methionine hydrolase (adenosine-forming)
MTLITLTTDFGLRDAYAGIMKGVILNINPSARVVDLTHQIAAQDLLAAAFEIQSSYRFFPTGSIHVVVVDPGVGGPRRIIAMVVDGQTFLAPDNGLAGLLAQMGTCTEIVSVKNSDLFRHPVSATFHGRDIFAPVAAHLSMGYAIGDVGPSLDQQELILPEYSRPMANEKGLVGTVVKTDRFGNLISDVGSDMIAKVVGGRKKADLIVRIKDYSIRGLSRTYGDVAPGRLLTLIGSSGYIEIAANCANAGQLINAGRGDRITIQWNK